MVYREVCVAPGCLLGYLCDGLPLATSLRALGAVSDGIDAINNPLPARILYVYPALVRFVKD